MLQPKIVGLCNSTHKFVESIVAFVRGAFGGKHTTKRGAPLQRERCTDVNDTTKQPEIPILNPAHCLKELT